MDKLLKGGIAVLFILIVALTEHNSRAARTLQGSKTCALDTPCDSLGQMCSVYEDRIYIRTALCTGEPASSASWQWQPLGSHEQH